MSPRKITTYWLGLTTVNKSLHGQSTIKYPDSPQAGEVSFFSIFYSMSRRKRFENDVQIHFDRRARGICD